MATTSPDNIYSPNIDDNWAVPQAMGAMADSVQDALNKRANLYVGTAQQRRNFTPDKSGVRWQDTDEGFKFYRWGGSRWGVGNPQKILWSGEFFMNETQTITLSEPISDQQNGVILVWGRFLNGAIDNSNFNYVHIPKTHIELIPGAGVTSVISLANSAPVSKYTYVHNSTISGLAANGVGDNRNFVLRWVLGY